MSRILSNTSAADLIDFINKTVGDNGYENYDVYGAGIAVLNRESGEIMGTMRFGNLPAGFKRVEPKLVIDQPIDDLIAGESIWPGDFIKDVEGTARRCVMDDATHTATHKAGEGETVKCARFDGKTVQSCALD